MLSRTGGNEGDGIKQEPMDIDDNLSAETALEVGTSRVRHLFSQRVFTVNIMPEIGKIFCCSKTPQ
jgi:hypothetical protein